MRIFKPKFWDEEKISLYSLILLPFTFFYIIIFWLSKFISKEKKFSIPIICVGNIYIGGTGKTPSVIKVYEILKELKMNPIVIKKNHKNQKDEILLLKKYCKVLVCDSRAQGINLAEKEKFNVAVLDDGYQDFKIKKNLNIICFNSKQKIGNGFLIPSGPLRQNLNSLKNCNLIFFNGVKNLNFEKKLINSNANLEFIYYRYSSKNLENFKGKKLIAFAGIGNPENFFDYLKDKKLNIIKEIKYPDHYIYSEDNLKYLIQLKKSFNAELITTEKDYMRINENYRQNFMCLQIEMILDKPEYLKKVLKRKFL